MAKAGLKIPSGEPDNGNAHNGNSEPEEVLRVRYTGRSDQRLLWSSESLSGDRSVAAWGLVWKPGSEVPYDVFLSLVESRTRASEILRAHAHEFELVGPGAQEFWDETDGDGVAEFDIQAPVL